MSIFRSLAVREWKSGTYKSGQKTDIVLWILQRLLGAHFAFAGGMKLVLPIEAMTKQTPLPGAFLRFVGLAEVLGAAGLILLGLQGIAQRLTPLAATGLVIIMIGATVITLAGNGLIPALIPAFVGRLATSVAYGRYQRVPHTDSCSELATQTA